MDRAALKTTYDQEGFVVVRGFLAGGELQTLIANLDRYIRDVVPGLPDGDAFYDDKTRPETLKQLNRIEQDDFFAEYRTNAQWRELAEVLLGESTKPTRGAEWFNKPPRTNHPTPPHQDNFYFCLSPPQVLTMWLALDEVDEENGCLRYVRGSHRLGLRAHQRTTTLGFSQGIPNYGADDYANEVAISAKPGDLLVHHGNTIHRADPNRSPTRHRRSFAMVFEGISCRRDDRAFERYSASYKAQHQSMGLQTS